MLVDKKKKEDEYIGWTFRANKIPMTTTDNLYEKITKEQAEKREEVKRLSMAITKQREKPFSFYIRDQERKAAGAPPVHDVMQHEPFRANKIPWKVLVPLYKRMMDKIEYDREQRIKRNAELSYAQSKLPPRMQEYESRRKEEQ